MLMKEVNIQSHVEKEIMEPINPTKVTKHANKEAIAKRILFNFVRDHFIPHFTKKRIVRVMFEALVGLFQSYKLFHNTFFCKQYFIYSHKIDIVVRLMIKIIELRNQLESIGMKMEDKEQVSIALNGLVPSQSLFVHGVFYHEDFPFFMNI